MSGAKPANPWRGERSVAFGGTSVVVAASMDDLARVFEATGTSTMAGLFTALEARNPALLKSVFDLLAEGTEEERAAAWSSVNGLQGLQTVHEAIIGAIGGQTPEEQAEAEKKLQAVEETAKAHAKEETVSVVREVVREMMPLLLETVQTPPQSPSENG